MLQVEMSEDADDHPSQKRSDDDDLCAQFESVWTEKQRRRLHYQKQDQRGPGCRN